MHSLTVFSDGGLQHFFVISPGANMPTVLAKEAVSVWRSSLNMNARTYTQDQLLSLTQYFYSVRL